MSMTILPDPSQQASKAPKEPRERPSLRLKREHVALGLVVVVLAAAGAFFWSHERGSSSSPAASPVAGTHRALGPDHHATPVAHLPRMSGIAFAHRVVRAYGQERGVHIVSKTTVDAIPVEVSGDVGQHAGTQLLQIGDQVAQARLVRGVVYVDGSAAILQHLSNFPAAVAALGAGRWVAVDRGDRPYRSLVDGMTLHNLFPATFGLLGKPRLVGPSVQNGVASVGIQGPERDGRHIIETIWVRAHGAPLPVTEFASGTTPKHSVQQSATFSGWGELVHAVAPRGAVSYQSLVAEAGV
jgi:hypothetical protein